LFFGKAGVHAVQVSGKKSGFIATGSAAYFHNNVLAVVGVFRNQQVFNYFLYLFFFLLQLFQLSFGQLAKLFVLFGSNNFLGVGNVGEDVLVLLVLRYNGLQVAVFFVQRLEFLDVA